MAAGEGAHPVELLEAEGDRLDEDVERGGAGLRRPRGTIACHLVHPRVGRVAVGNGMCEQGGPGRLLVDRPAELGGQLERAQLALARESIAGFALERRRARHEHLSGQLACLLEHRFVRGLAEGPGRGGDPAAGPGDLLVRDARDLLLVLLRAPARERQVGVAVDEAREECAAAWRRRGCRRPWTVSLPRWFRRRC